MNAENFSKNNLKFKQRMDTIQLNKLLTFYKMAVAKNFTAIDFAKEMKETGILLDRSFVENGKENMNLGIYLEELKSLKAAINYE